MPEGSPSMRVVEVGERLSGAFAGRLLAGLGHDVVQVRGDGLQRDVGDLESAFYDRGRTVVEVGGGGGPGGGDGSGGGSGAGGESGAGEAVAEVSKVSEVVGRLLHHADLLLLDIHPRRLRRLGLPRTEDDLARIRPGLAGVAVTSFGLSGPHAEYEMCEITDWAAGGLSYVTRRAVPRDAPERYSPVLPAGRQAELLGGLAGALGAVAAHRLARQTGRSVLADVSRQEVLASMSHSYLPWFVQNQVLLGTPDTRVDWGWLVPAADGEVYIRTVETSQWDRLVEWMGSPDWAVRRPDELPVYHQAPEIVAPLIGEWSRQHPKAWLLDEAVRWRVPVAPPRTIPEVLAWPHLHERGVWEEIGVGDDGVAMAPRLPLAAPVAPSRRASWGDVVARWSGAPS